jgi:hypothetical protein
MPRKIKRAKLSAAQIEIAGQFNDYAFENPGLTFDEVVLKEFGALIWPAGNVAAV